MTSLQLEGDLSFISKEQQDFITKRINDLGFKDNKVTFEPVGKLGDNYAANVKRIIVHKENGDTFNIIAKLATQIPAVREMMNTEIMFDNEVIVYEEVFPKLNELERKAGIPKEERFKHPAFYGSLKEIPNEVVLLEDMGVYGYGTKDKLTPLDDDTIRYLLKTFAQWHGLSYALYNKDREAFDSFRRMRNIWVALYSSPLFKKETFDLMEQQFMSMVDDEEVKNKCKGLLSQLVEHEVSITQRDADAKQNVIVHGDSWTNNFLFKMEDEALASCVLIDYQLSRVSHPASDLLYLIFSSADYQTIKQNFHDWLQYYHSELDKYLFNFDLKVQTILPYDKFDADIRRYARASIASSLLVLMMILREGAAVKDIKNNEEAVDIAKFAEELDVKHLDQQTMLRIVGRVRGTLMAAVELGLL